MAIVANQQEDEELNQPGAAPAPQGGGGGFVGGDTGGGGTTAKAAPGAPTSSGSFTNLSNYLQANQGAGAQAGKAAANVVDQAGDKASQAQDSYSSAGTGDVLNAGAAVNVDPSVVGKLKSGEIAAKDAQVSWKGPNSVSDFTGDTAGKQTAALGATQDVQGKAKAAAGGQSGVASLLRDAYQQPSYTAGENNLDSFLAGGTPSGQKELGRAAGIAQNAQGGYDQINKTLNDQINKEKGWVDSTNKTYNNAIWQNPASNTNAAGEPISLEQKKAGTGTQAAQTTFATRKPTAQNIQWTPPTAASQQVVFKSRSPTPAAPPPPPKDPNQLSTNNPNNYTPNDLKILAQNAAKGAAEGRDPVADTSTGWLPQQVRTPVQSVQEATAPENVYDNVKKRILGGR